MKKCDNEFARETLASEPKCSMEQKLKIFFSFSKNDQQYQESVVNTWSELDPLVIFFKHHSDSHRVPLRDGCIAGTKNSKSQTLFLLSLGTFYPPTLDSTTISDSGIGVTCQM